MQVVTNAGNERCFRNRYFPSAIHRDPKLTASLALLLTARACGIRQKAIDGVCQRPSHENEIFAAQYKYKRYNICDEPHTEFFMFTKGWCESAKFCKQKLPYSTNFLYLVVDTLCACLENATNYGWFCSACISQGITRSILFGFSFEENDANF